MDSGRMGNPRTNVSTPSPSPNANFNAQTPPPFINIAGRSSTTQQSHTAPVNRAISRTQGSSVPPRSAHRPYNNPERVERRERWRLEVEVSQAEEAAKLAAAKEAAAAHEAQEARAAMVAAKAAVDASLRNALHAVPTAMSSSTPLAAPTPVSAAITRLSGSTSVSPAAAMKSTAAGKTAGGTVGKAPAQATTRPKGIPPPVPLPILSRQRSINGQDVEVTHTPDSNIPDELMENVRTGDNALRTYLMATFTPPSQRLIVETIYRTVNMRLWFRFQHLTRIGLTLREAELVLMLYRLSLLTESFADLQN